MCTTIAVSDAMLGSLPARMALSPVRWSEPSRRMFTAWPAFGSAAVGVADGVAEAPAVARTVGLPSSDAVSIVLMLESSR